MIEEEFSIDEIISSLDLLDDNVNEAVISGLKEGGKLIEQQQKALINAKSPKLASLIKVGNIYTTKKSNKVRLKIGYDTEAIRAAPESVIMEFGRPGKHGKSQDNKMAQKRSMFNGRGKRKIIENATVRIGKIEPIPHIRKGFDIAKEEATEVTIKALKEVLKW